MKPIQIVFAVIAAVFLFLLFRPQIEHFVSDAPYCSAQNSCLGSGCSLDPSKQVCKRTQFVKVKMPKTDPHWGSLIGGSRIPICLDDTGGKIGMTACSKCSTCGWMTPPNGSESYGLCMPLNEKGCLDFDAPAPLVEYANKDPGALTCCALGEQPPV